MNPKSTDCEADALTTTPPRRFDDVTTIKAATIKYKDCKKDFHEAGLPLTPDSVITRWATWLRAALHLSEYFPAVCTTVNN